VVREPTKKPRGRDLQEQAHGSHGIGVKGAEAEARHNAGRIGVEGSLRAVVQQGNEGMHPQPPVGEGLLERTPVDLFLLLALHRVVHQHARAQNVQLALAEPRNTRQEGRARVLEAVGKAESEDKAAEDGEDAHDGEEPEPSGPAADAAHVQDAECEQLGRGLAELVAEVEEHDALGGLAAGVPCREGPQTARNEARLGDAQQEAREDEGTIRALEGLEGRDEAEEEELEREPLAGADAVQDHVGGDLEEHDAQRQHLLADVELILRDADILHEVVGDGVGDVAAVELETEEAQGEQRHDDEIEPRSCMPC